MLSTLKKCLSNYGFLNILKCKKKRSCYSVEGKVLTEEDYFPLQDLVQLDWSLSFHISRKLNFVAFCRYCHIAYYVEIMSMSSLEFQNEMANIGKEEGYFVLVNLILGYLTLGSCQSNHQLLRYVMPIHHILGLNKVPRVWLFADESGT